MTLRVLVKCSTTEYKLSGTHGQQCHVTSFQGDSCPASGTRQSACTALMRHEANLKLVMFRYLDQYLVLAEIGQYNKQSLIINTLDRIKLIY